MGTKCAPPYARLYMGWVENLHILPKIREQIIMYVRYIADIFFIWKGSEKELLKFLDEVNKIHPTIKFDYHYSRESVNFLDTTVKYINKKFITTLFTKPTDRRAYLHPKSYHSNSTKKSIAYSHASRLRRICTNLSEFWEHANNLKKILLIEGIRNLKYPERYREPRTKNVEHCSLIKKNKHLTASPLLSSATRTYQTLRASSTTHGIISRSTPPGTRISWETNSMLQA